jgi:hypothetical protein
MPFTLRTLSCLAYANGYTFWHYQAGNDTLEQVTAPGYFRDAADLFTPGDTVAISTREGVAFRAVAHDPIPTLQPLL